MLPTRTTPSPNALTVDSVDVEGGLQIADVDHLPVIGRIWDELGLRMLSVIIPSGNATSFASSVSWVMTRRGQRISFLSRTA